MTELIYSSVIASGSQSGNLFQMLRTFFFEAALDRYSQFRSAFLCGSKGFQSGSFRDEDIIEDKHFQYYRVKMDHGCAALRRGLQTALRGFLRKWTAPVCIEILFQLKPFLPSLPGSEHILSNCSFGYSGNVQKTPSYLCG